jgi:hypothetical protein
MFLIIAIALPPLAILRWKRGERAVPVIYLFGALLNAALFFQKVLGW